MAVAWVESSRPTATPVGLEDSTHPTRQLVHDYPLALAAPFQDFNPRSQTPVWERPSAKLCFASQPRRETEFPAHAFPNRSLGTRGFIPFFVFSFFRVFVILFSNRWPFMVPIRVLLE